MAIGYAALALMIVFAMFAAYHAMHIELLRACLCSIAAEKK